MSQRVGRPIVVALLATVAWACHTGSAPGAAPLTAVTIRGIVTDSSTGQPIHGAAIRASRAKTATGPSDAIASGATDSLGRFKLTVPVRGRLYISARYIGYGPIVVGLTLPSDSAKTILLVLPRRTVYMQQ